MFPKVSLCGRPGQWERPDGPGHRSLHLALQIQTMIEGGKEETQSIFLNVREEDIIEFSCNFFINCSISQNNKGTVSIYANIRICPKFRKFN